MNKKVFFLMFVLLFASFTFADSYYPFSEGSGANLGDVWSSLDGTISGASWSSNVPIYINNTIPQNYSLDFNGVSDIVTTPISDFKAISLWFNVDNLKTTSYNSIFKDDGSGANLGDVALLMRYDVGYTNTCNLNVLHDGWNEVIAINDCNLDTWYNFIGNANGTNWNFYIDGVSKLNISETVDFGTDNVVDLDLGNYNGAGASLDGLITNVQVFTDDYLNATEISNLAECGNIECITVFSNFTITSKSDYNSVSISNFSVDINGTVYNTTTGSVVTNILGNNVNLYNITFFDDDWYNRTYVDYNVSEGGDLIGFLNQTDILVNFKFSNGDFADFGPINFTDLNNSLFFNVTGGQLNFSPIANIITFAVSCDNEIFAPFNYTFNFTPLMNQSFNLVVNETQNVLTFLDANTSSPINDSNITIYFPSGFNLSLMTNESGQVSFSYIQNNITEFGDYIFNFAKVGFVGLNISEEINSSVVPFFATYNISRAKLTINIYDRVTGLLMSGVNVSVAFIGLFNETTLTGTIVKDNLTIVGGDYLIYAGSEGYKTSVRSLTFTNQEEFTINFYIMNLSEPTFGTIFVTTSDSFFRKITGAKVELLQYIPDSLSYISVSECVTNINSECAFAVELNTKVYYLRATSLIDGEFLVAETSQNGEIFTVNNDIRNLIFYTRDDFIVSPVDNLIYNIDESFVGNVSEITVEFNSYDGSAIEVCIEYFLKVGTNFTSVTGDTYCLVSSSAIQNIDTSVTLNRSNAYEARVYIKQSSGNLVLNSYTYPSITSASAVFDDDMKGAIIVIFWVMALAFCLHGKNITLWFVFAIILSWLEVALFPSYTVVGVSVFKTIISGFTIMVARRRRD